MKPVEGLDWVCMKIEQRNIAIENDVTLLSTILETTAILTALFGDKSNFYIVNKDPKVSLVAIKITQFSVRDY